MLAKVNKCAVHVCMFVGNFSSASVEWKYFIGNYQTIIFVKAAKENTDTQIV